MSHESLNNAPKDVFMSALEIELAGMLERGEIDAQRAEEKRVAASQIEEGLSDDPVNDARIFSRAGIAGEGEMVDLLNKSS